ncbi:MAG TPA: response regulator [Ferruginibacter sp.]|nr:response regulator [Ferruginibacter sp.]
MKTNGQAILIVDDSALIIERLLAMLHGLGSVNSIATASNYRDAVAALSKQEIDIAILDIHLTGKNGIDLLKFIVKNYPEIKVVMLSNAGNHKYRELCEKEGALYFVDKSKEFELVPDILSKLN